MSRTIDLGKDFIDHLIGKVDALEGQYNWHNLPASFVQGALKRLKAELKPYLDGQSTNEINARIAVSRASSFDAVRSAIRKLEVQ